MKLTNIYLSRKSQLLNSGIKRELLPPTLHKETKELRGKYYRQPYINKKLVKAKAKCPLPGLGMKVFQIWGFFLDFTILCKLHLPNTSNSKIMNS